MRCRFLLGLLLVVMVVVAVVAPASAHRRPEADAVSPATTVAVVPPLVETVSSSAPEAAPPWGTVAIVACAALAVAWRPRRVLALALVLVAGVLAFETGVHSAHHLGQADEAARCAVAGMATQLSADLVDSSIGAVPARVLETRLAVPAAPVVTARVIAPDAGRAPPVLPA